MVFIRSLLIFLVFSTPFIYAQNSESEYLTLENALDRALSLNNQVSNYAVQQAKWQQRNALTQLFPVVSFNTRYSWIDDSTYALRDFSRYFQDPSSPFQIPKTVFQNSYVSSFDLNMPVFNGSLYNGLSIAGTNTEMTEKNDESTYNRIVFQVIRNYLDVLKNEEIRDVQKEYLKLSKLNFDKATRMYNAGRSSKTESLRWQIEYQKQKGVLVNSESTLLNSRSSLNRLLNYNLKKDIKIEKKIPENLQNEVNLFRAYSKEEMFKIINLSEEELIEANAALNAYMLAGELSRLQYRGTYASFLPDVSLSYSYAWRENNTIKLDDYSPKTLMVNLSFPLFSSFQDYTRLKANYYEYKKSQEELQDQIKNTQYTLSQLVNRIQTLKTQLELAELNVEFNELNYQAVEKQMEKGTVSNIDLVDAKINLQNAQLENISNQYDFISSVVELHYLLGKINIFID